MKRTSVYEITLMYFEKKKMKKIDEITLHASFTPLLPLNASKFTLSHHKMVK